MLSSSFRRRRWLLKSLAWTRLLERADDILDIDLPFVGDNPRMRIGLTLVVTLGDGMAVMPSLSVGALASHRRSASNQ